MKFLLSAVAAVFVAGPAFAASNLVVNGGFEAAPSPANGYILYAGGATFPGWTATGHDVGTIDGGYSEGGLVFNANSGNNAIDLTGAGNTGAADGITQTIATIAGKRYTLTFFVGNASPTGGNASSYLSPSTLDLSINSGAISSYTNSDDTAFGINWKSFSTTFTATGPTTLAFSNGTVSTDNYLGLDDVSATAVPEPTTWAMMIGGIAMVGFATRRRRQTAVAA